MVTTPRSLIIILIVSIGFVAGVILLIQRTEDEATRRQMEDTAETIPSPFIFSFNTDGLLAEASSSYESASPYWWLDSGGYLRIDDGIGQTVQGNLTDNDRWRRLYSKNNPTDTDDGYHPQNIFRLVSRSRWKNVREEVYFRINADNLSSSPNRNESNGLLLFSRYKDGDNLYYTGVRVDGTAVIKKKIDGVYYPLDQRPLFDGAKYDRTQNPNLLPKATWIGLRSETLTATDGKVLLKLYVDIGKRGTWELAAEAVDDGTLGGPILNEKSYAGIRTDFMDVDFSDYRAEEVTT